MNVKQALPDTECWVAELDLIPEELRIEEAELRLNRWFDYHDLLPGQATLLFALTYNDVAQDYWDATMGINRVMKKPIDTDVLMRDECDLAIWRARQEADRLGVRYEFMIRFMFARFLNRGFTFFPRPNQLYSEEALLDLKDALTEHRAYCLEFGQSDFFKNESFVGHPDQIRHHEYLIRQVKMRQVNRHPSILKRLTVTQPVLPMSVIEREFDAETISRIF